MSETDAIPTAPAAPPSAPVEPPAAAVPAATLPGDQSAVVDTEQVRHLAYFAAKGLLTNTPGAGPLIPASTFPGSVLHSSNTAGLSPGPHELLLTATGFWGHGTVLRARVQTSTMPLSEAVWEDAGDFGDISEPGERKLTVEGGDAADDALEPLSMRVIFSISGIGAAVAFSVVDTTSQ